MLQPASIKTICLTLVIALGLSLLPVVQVEAQRAVEQQKRFDQSSKKKAGCALFCNV